MSLTLKELGSLLSVLSEDATQSQSFEALGFALNRYFGKQDHFKVGTALVLMLQNNDLLPHPTQRLGALYLLFDMYRNELPTHPFSPVFVHILNPPLESGDPGHDYHWAIKKVSIQEKFFVAQLLTTYTKDIPKKSAIEVLQMDTTNLANIDISGIQLTLVERQSELPATAKASIPCIIGDPDMRQARIDQQLNKGGPINPEVQKATLEALVTEPGAAGEKCLKPEFLHLAPPLHSARDELIWMNPTVENHSVMWDYNMTATQSAGSDVRRLMLKAFKAALSVNQQEQLITALDHDPRIIYHIGLTPAKLPVLVENNPMVAINVLLKLMSSSQITEYFNVLVNMEMSLHSMEVVNRLTNVVDLPPEFIHLYISNCITTCERMKEKYMQSRLVRLVCVFLQALIRNKIIDVKDIFIEVQAFCIEFSKIREAAGLFRLLRSLDAGGSVDGPKQP